jgi:hypothetical protein
MRLVFGGHFWQGIKVGRGLSLQFSGELANVLCIIQSVASYALLLLQCMYRVDRQWCGFFPPAAAVAGQWCGFLPPNLKFPGWQGQNLEFLYQWLASLDLDIIDGLPCATYRCDDQIMKTSGSPPLLWISISSIPLRFWVKTKQAMNLL